MKKKNTVPALDTDTHPHNLCIFLTTDGHLGDCFKLLPIMFAITCLYGSEFASLLLTIVDD